MPNTIRETAVSTIETRLRQIDGTGSYTSSMKLVERVRTPNPNVNTFPSCFIFEGEESKNNDIGSMTCSLQLIIVCMVQDYSNQAERGNEVLGDMILALGEEFSVTGSNGVQGTVQVVERGNDIVVEDDIVSVAMDVDVIYGHLMGDPFNVSS